VRKTVEGALVARERRCGGGRVVEGARREAEEELARREAMAAEVGAGLGACSGGVCASASTGLEDSCADESVSSAGAKVDAADAVADKVEPEPTVAASVSASTPAPG
jgi:hypothetical protein